MGEKECEHCGGEGVVRTDIFDPDSGQWMRGVGTQRCICGGELKVEHDVHEPDTYERTERRYILKDLMGSDYDNYFLA